MMQRVDDVRPFHVGAFQAQPVVDADKSVAQLIQLAGKLLVLLMVALTHHKTTAKHEQHTAAVIFRSRLIHIQIEVTSIAFSELVCGGLSQQRIHHGQHHPDTPDRR